MTDDFVRGQLSVAVSLLAGFLSFMIVMFLTNEVFAPSICAIAVYFAVLLGFSDMTKEP